MPPQRIHLSSTRRPGLCDFVPRESVFSRFSSRYEPDVLKLGALLRENGIESLLEPYRLLALIELVRHAASHTNGDMIELGVYKGGSAAAIAWALSSRNQVRTFHLCDTFEGMPESLEWEWHRPGDFSDTSYENVAARLSSFLPSFPFRFHRGLFSETLPALADKEFCFAHVDADLYESVRGACEFVYPRMSKGGIIVFDDYGASTCPGATRAVDDFFQDKLEKPSHIATSSYGVRIGHRKTDFHRLILSATLAPAVISAFWNSPQTTLGTILQAVWRRMIPQSSHMSTK
jgi:O-methyltransferase